MTQPPGSSGDESADPSPEGQVQQPPWGAPPPAQQPPGGYGPPPGQPPPGQYGPPAGQYPVPGQPQWGHQPPGLAPQEERTWAMFAHIGAIIAGFLAMAFLGPLLIMLIQGPKSAFVRRHAVESLNFQLTLLIALAAGVVLSILTLGIALLVFIPVAIVVGIAALVLTVVAGVRANNGEDYRYPINIRMVK